MGCFACFKGRHKQETVHPNTNHNYPEPLEAYVDVQPVTTQTHLVNNIDP